MVQSITVPVSQTVSIRKSALVVDDLQSWPRVSLEKVFAYGLQQLLNDAAAPAKTPEEVTTFVQKRLDNLRAGILRSTAIRIGDPVEKEAMRIARERVLDAAKKASRELTSAEITDLAKKMLIKYPDIRDVARQNVELASALDVDVDLDDIEVEGDDE